ncbi:MAG: stage II sporulation protein D [Clostridia bacterium]
MKKWLVFFFSFLLIISIILVIINFVTTKNSETSIGELKKEEKEEKDNIEYKANQTIRVKITKTGEIIAMDINDYLRGVVASEMPAAYNIEALKAQAVVARTYTYRKMLEHADGENADICDNFRHCQAFYIKPKLMEIWKGRGFDDKTRIDYWDKINEAVVSTQNEVITYNGKYIKAFFHASSPIKTEDISQIWGHEELSYLKSVENTEYDDYTNRYSIVKVSYEDLEKKIQENINEKFDINQINMDEIKINSYTTSLRIKDIIIGKQLISAEKLRTLFGLKSTLFTMNVVEDGVIFNVIGYGHGVGLSQVGSNYLADKGNNYKDIIKHYYTGIEIIKIAN